MLNSLIETLSNDELDKLIDQTKEALEPLIQCLAERLASALDNGTPEGKALYQTILDIVNRYVFISAYVSVNRMDPEWPQLAVELLSTDDVWLDSTAEIVLRMFQLRRLSELAYRTIRIRAQSGEPAGDSAKN